MKDDREGNLKSMFLLLKMMGVIGIEILMMWKSKQISAFFTERSIWAFVR